MRPRRSAFACLDWLSRDLVGFLAENKADGGVDLFLNQAPASPTEFIHRECVFQFKLSCPSGSKLKHEIKNGSRALELLRNGADYVLLSGADFATEQYQPKLEAAIKSLIPKWSGQCRVWNAQSLLQECLRCSGTLPSFKEGLGNDVVSWSDWQSEDRFSIEEYQWTPDPARRDLIKAFDHRTVKDLINQNLQFTSPFPSFPFPQPESAKSRLGRFSASLST